MKKVIFIVATVLFLLGVAGYVVYDVVKDNEPTVETEIVESDVLENLNVEDIRLLDMEYMKIHYDDYSFYKWFETCILMNDWLDAEETPAVFGVANIFQVEKKIGRNTRCKVILVSHNVVKDTVDVRNGFWVEDFDLTNEEVVLTFEEAYDVFNRANVRKPHSKHVVLRKAIGPNHADTYHAQYIFGNADCHYYVDAVTGELNTVDPSGIPEDGKDDPYLFLDR